MTDLTEMMLQIVALDSGASLKVSPYTQQWYVEARIEISDGCMLSGATEHRDSPGEAVRAYVDRLREADGIHEVVVSRSQGDDRQNWVWNGGAFALLSPTLMQSFVESARERVRVR